MQSLEGQGNWQIQENYLGFSLMRLLICMN